MSYEIFKIRYTSSYEIFKIRYASSYEIFKIRCTSSYEIFNTIRYTSSYEIFKILYTSSSEIFKIRYTSSYEIFKIRYSIFAFNKKSISPGVKFDELGFYRYVRLPQFIAVLIMKTYYDLMINNFISQKMNLKICIILLNMIYYLRPEGGGSRSQKI